MLQAEKAACVKSEPMGPGKQGRAEIQGACGGIGDSREEPGSDQARGALYPWGSIWKFSILILEIQFISYMTDTVPSPLAYSTKISKLTYS